MEGSGPASMASMKFEISEKKGSSSERTMRGRSARERERREWKVKRTRRTGESVDFLVVISRSSDEESLEEREEREREGHQFALSRGEVEDGEERTGLL